MLRFLFLPSVLLLLTSCSLLDPVGRRSAPGSSIPVRDVPYKARSSEQGLRKRILVLPFINERPNASRKVAEVARRSVVAQLQVSQRVVVVTNSDFPKKLSSFLLENKEYDLEAVAKVASSLGVAAVIEGKILEVRAKRMGDERGIFRQVRAQVDTTVRLRVASARNGRIVLDETRKGYVETKTTKVGQSAFSDRDLSEDPKLIQMSVHKAFLGAIGRIFQSIEKLSWEGRIAMVAGEKIYINAGRLSGLQIGDILKVLEEGNEVFDPETGSFIGHAPGRMKGTVEVVSYFGRDGAVGIVHSGSGFRDNDKVELY